MANELNAFQRFTKRLTPSGRDELKRLNYNQSLASALDRSVYGYNTQSGYFPSDKLEDIGNGSGNSAVAACLSVLATAFAEPRLQVFQEDDAGQDVQLSKHPISKLFKRPNPFMSGAILSHYLVSSMSVEGDAYLYKNRNKNGQVIQLVPLMPSYIHAKGNTEKLITHYEYTPNTDTVDIPTNDIIHIRTGVDPNDHRRGYAPIKTVLREILGDEAAGQYSTALLHNMAIPGVILSPSGDAMGGPTREEAEAISEMYKAKFGGENRGQPMVLTGAMNIDVVSFSPSDMNLIELRRLPEERVAAVMGVPAVLAGLGAGLNSATYSNTRELREYFTEQKLVPLWRTVADELTYQLLPEFDDNDNIYCKYDVESVRALSQDQDELYKRMNSAVSGGWATIGEARNMVGLPADDSHNVYLRPLNMQQVGASEVPAQQNAEDTSVPVGGDDPLDIPAATIDQTFGLEEDIQTKDVMDTGDAIPESTRQAIAVTPTRGMDMFNNQEAAEERAKQIGCEGSHTHEIEDVTYYMPCESHESYQSTKKSYIEKMVEELKVSLEEAEAMYERGDDLQSPEEKGKDDTNFPSPDMNQAVRISNSKYKQFPYSYAKDLKENWGEIWRMAGNGGNPPTSFTGNDAFRRWSAYQSGDRSESVLNWVRRRERYMGRHQNDKRLNGVIAAIKWGGVLNIGVPAMKAVINERKKLVRERRKKASDLADEMAMKAVSARIRKILKDKVTEHNAGNPKFRTTTGTLAKVFNRGVGAYRTNPGSVRGNVRSADQWALARVNGFLRALRTGRFKRKPYDTDLLPSGHPSKSSKSESKAKSVKVGQSVSWSIDKSPQPPSTVHGVVVSVNSGDKEATMQVWAILEDGSHKKTDRRVTQPISSLRIISDIT
tara:strand:- start:5068 stop:7731 length:2664 start_codon:yes stop_codon:yes gene_type:complete